jgi:hypothetical protein
MEHMLRGSQKQSDTGGKGLITQWVHCEFIKSSETIHLVVIQQVRAGFFLESTHQNTQWVLSQFYFQCAHCAPEPLIKGSFKNHPSMGPQCTQWVLSKVLTANSQLGSILPQTLKELIGYTVSPQPLRQQELPRAMTSTSRSRDD